MAKLNRPGAVPKVDHYVTDGPGYAGVLYVIVWGIPTACVLIRTPEGRLAVQTD